MKKNVSLPSSLSCTGCGACSAVCPCAAIEMKVGDEGFYVPDIDENKCIDCGLCQKVCYKYLPPVQNTVPFADKSVMGLYSSDAAVQQATTSGGFAYELSRWGLRNGYKIFGVVYDYADNCARNILTADVADLERLKSSKYLQSETQPALTSLLQEAEADASRKYICVGTPCQIFGLRQLIVRKRLKNEFIFVDLFCHGVPSRLVWNPYVAQQRRDLGDLRHVNFRYKGNGWHQYTIRLEGERKTYQQYAYKDIFYRYFFDNVALNTSCYTCTVRKAFTAADLRIGDFLGGTYEHRDDGISAVLVATPKGREVLENLRKEKLLTVDKEWKANVCLASQSTHDYSLLELRNKVITRLRTTRDIRAVQHWYFKQLPLKIRIRSFLKIAATSLPNAWIVRMRRLIRL